MALSRTQRIASNSSDSHGTGAYTTASFTPNDSSLLVVVASIMQEGGTQDPSDDLTISDSVGLTWTPQLNVGNASEWSVGTRIWTAPVTTGASMTVSIDAGALNSYRYNVAVYDYTGYDTGDPVGAVASDNNMATDGSDTLTLNATPATDSDVLAFLTTDMNGTVTVVHGTGWTELFDLSGTNTLGMQGQVRTGSTSTTVTWDDVSSASNWKTIGCAIEIKASGGVFTLEAEPASYLMSGTNANVGRILTLVAEAAAYAMTGNAAALTAFRTLLAASTAYVMTGTAALLLHHKVLQALGTSYTMTGTTADLRYQRVLAALGTTYAMTGQDTTFIHRYVLTAEGGAFVLTGQDASLEYTPVAGEFWYWPFYE